MGIDPAVGGGPWYFDIPALGVDAIHMLDFRNMKYNGRRRYFDPWLPLDQITITNTSASEPVEITINDQYRARVQPSSIETFDRVGVTRISVKNVGGAGIAADEIQVEVLKEPWSADDEALRRREEPAWRNVIRNFTGI